jgi:hypothetical protein
LPFTIAQVMPSQGLSISIYTRLCCLSHTTKKIKRFSTTSSHGLMYIFWRNVLSKNQMEMQTVFEELANVWQYEKSSSWSKEQRELLPLNKTQDSANVWHQGCIAGRSASYWEAAVEQHRIHWQINVFWLDLEMVWRLERSQYLHEEACACYTKKTDLSDTSLIFDNIFSAK